MAVYDGSFTPHPTTYKGIRFRSRLEAKWAAFFDQIAWPWEYEPFDLGAWSPDFLIKGPQRSLLVEVKPVERFDAKAGSKMRMAAKDSGCDLLLCGVAPIIDPEYFGGIAEVYSHCQCGDDKCAWMTRFWGVINGRVDVVFGHWPFYPGAVTGLDANADENDYDRFIGREIAGFWATACNAVQYLP